MSRRQPVGRGGRWLPGAGVLAHPGLTFFGSPILLTPATGRSPALHPATAAYLGDHTTVNRGYILGLQGAVVGRHVR